MIHRLRKLLREIHRRALWQVLGVYLAGAWAGLQTVGYLNRVGWLPDWTPGLTLVLLMAGVPVVAITAFVQEGVPLLRGEYRDVEDPNTLKGLTPEQVHRNPSGPPWVGGRVFTWRNAVLGGVGAATLLVGSVAAYFAMWAAGVGPMGSLVAQGVLSPGDGLAVSHFRDDTGEGWGERTTRGLGSDLSRSELLRVVSGDGASSETGVRAVLSGTVSQEGRRYVIVATLQESRTGRTLATFQVTSRRAEDLPLAIQELSHDIREKSGESLRSIRASRSLDDSPR